MNHGWEAYEIASQEEIGREPPRDREPTRTNAAWSSAFRSGVARKFSQLRSTGAGALVAFLAVLGPGMLAGLSDDDPAGITTYSVLGTDYGYRLLWIIALMISWFTG